MEWLYDASSWVIPVVLAITLHEAAHGWVALKFGDDTAKSQGRVTANPLKHIDRFGTIILPGLLMLLKSPFVFGYAKPVPVAFSRLQPRRQGMFMVALAGPATNVILAVASALLLHADRWVTPEEAPWLYENLYHSLLINCVLAVFNMIPVLPLDGGRVVASVLPIPALRYFNKLEPVGIWLVLMALMIPSLFDSDIAQRALAVPVYWLLEQVMWVTANTQPV